MKTHPSRRPQDAWQEGFSLLEMIVVLTIIALISSLTIARSGRENGNRHIGSTIQSIGALAHQARLFSITTGRSASIVIDTKNRTLSFGGTNQTITIVGKVSMEVETAVGLVHADTARIAFYPDGGSTGGVIKLTNQDGSAGEVQISWITGIPSIRKLEKQDK